MNYTDEYLRTQIAYLEKRKLKKIGVLLTDHPYLEEMLEALKRNLSDGQTVTIIDRFQRTDMQIRSTISKIKRSEFDVIGIFLYPGQVAQYYQQAREQELSIPTFGTNLFESVSEIKLANGTMTGAIFANNVVRPEFTIRYESHFKNTSQIGFGALGYEFAVTIGRLFHNSLNTLSSKRVLAKLASVNNQPGIAAGPYSFRRSDITGQDFQFPIAIKQISGNGFCVLEVY